MFVITDLIEILVHGMYWINLAQDRVPGRGLIKTAVNYQVLINS
jgi:hypothetical protein